MLLIVRTAIAYYCKMVKEITELRRILKETFGYSSFRFEQEKVINSVISGQDTMAIMPTGGGKSLCYQLPALYLDGVTIVISPLISLMQDQVAGLTQYGVKAAFLNSSLSLEEKIKVENQLKNGEIKLIYIAPERAILDSTISLLKSIKISLIAIDEAHCVSLWGHEFRKDYTRLYELKKAFPDIATIALTATADEKTRIDISRQLALKNPNVFVASFDRPNIKYMIYERENELKQLHQFIQDNHKGHTGIVYCLSRKKVEKVAGELKKLGYKAVAYHAGLSNHERTKSQKRFDHEDGLIVVATIAFGMGIDRPDVRFVAHLDLPKSIEGYYQETGRAGRDGLPSNAWMVYGLSDVVKHSRMLEMSEAGEDYKKAARIKLDLMLSLCEVTRCRRQFLLDYFGETNTPPCQNCDSCIEPPEMWNATIAAQKMLSTIFRTGQMFGSTYLIDVLRGSQSERILENKHDSLSVYGIGKDLSRGDWDSLIRQLLYLDYIYIKDYDFKNLALTEKSREILTHKKTLELRKLRLKVEKTPRKNKSSGSKDKSVSEHERPDLFEKLKKLRTEIATKNKVPPYIIFSDKTLHDMCAILPQNRDQMLMVHGVGETKFDNFGAVFMNVIKEET